MHNEVGNQNSLVGNGNIIRVLIVEVDISLGLGFQNFKKEGSKHYLKRLKIYLSHYSYNSFANIVPKDAKV